MPRINGKDAFNPNLGYFASTLTSVLTLAGVAIGLGNVWRFPYMMGAHGGSAFLVIYLVFMLIIAIPALMAELSLARAHRGATIRVLSISFGPFGRALGYALVAGVFIGVSYYTLIVGNVFYTTGYSILNGFSGADLEEFAGGMRAPGTQYALALAILWSALFVISRGLKQGIERVSNLFVPFFFVVCVYLVWFSLSRPGATDAVLTYLKPDFSQIGMTEVFAALGQCFFSVGLGAAYVLVYGKYLQDSSRIRSVAQYTALSDLGASLLVSLFIVPTVLLAAQPLDAGPHLLFDTLPRLFSVLDGARFSGSLFLLALSLVAYLSVIGLANVIIVSLEEEPLGAKLGRQRLLVLIGVLESILFILPAWNTGMIGWLDLVIGSGMPVLGCLFAVLAVGWRVQRSEAWRQLFADDRERAGRTAFFFWLRWVIPLGLISVLLGTVFDALFA
ncbi:sodium-dependent transporter [Elongatibacter sediminis]|uniref:Sodium-dependent transporter n=1 Tax=Elongatibacter sediminis TaxID=3119006 RepID=A0AAW9R6T9_9GAMM